MPQYAAAALLLLTVGIVGWRISQPPPIPVLQYATSIGEQRTLRLVDGSMLLLDTDSAVSVRYSDKDREVVLERGRAQFAVASDAQRPFRVRAGDGTIRDIGTRFQVRREADGVTVALLDGIVAVSVPGPAGSTLESTLAAGQQISFDQHGHLGPTRSLDLDIANGWTRGDLVFKDRSLADLVEEMNRYSTTKLRLGDASLRELAVSGVFHAGDQESLLQALQSGWSLRIERVSQHEFVVHPERG